MDGVTDAAFRCVVDTLSKPDVMYTEFVPVEGIKAGAERVLDAFVTHSTDTPLVAQLYGTDLGAYYLATIVVCALGFDGVDINMGCPARSVHSRGAGAGLIKTPDLAKEIVHTVRQATLDFAREPDITRFDVPKQILDKVNKITTRQQSRKAPIAVSLKTRIGFALNEVDTWLPQIASARPDCITLHGRTLMQMYKGMADWDAIRAGRDIVKQESSEIAFLGNGDIKSMVDARRRIGSLQLDGVLVGRATLGNPWFFLDEENAFVSQEVVLGTMMLHAERLTHFFPEKNFISLRKHMLWYADRSPMLKKKKELFQKILNIDDLKNAIKESA